MVLRDLTMRPLSSARPYCFKFEINDHHKFPADPYPIAQLYSFLGFNISEYCPDRATHGRYWSGWVLTQSESWGCRRI
jgi:hypothetical protein